MRFRLGRAAKKGRRLKFLFSQEASLWFAPCPDPRSIAVICSIKHATLHPVIGQSQMYASAAARDNGIASCKTKGPGAAISDLSV